MEEWELVEFKKASVAEKKYAAILKDKFTGRLVAVSFGRPGYWHYKDSTGLGLYSHLDHLNDERRQKFKERFSGYLMPQMYNPAFFSFHYLW